MVKPVSKSTVSGSGSDRRPMSVVSDVLLGSCVYSCLASDVLLCGSTPVVDWESGVDVSQNLESANDELYEFISSGHGPFISTQLALNLYWRFAL